MIGYSRTPKRKRRLPVSKAEPSNSYLTAGMRPRLSNRSGLCRALASSLAIRSGAESGIIVFGGGGRGCSGIGCLGWILISVVLSVVLTVLANLFLYLLSGPAVGF